MCWDHVHDCTHADQDVSRTFVIANDFFDALRVIAIAGRVDLQTKVLGKRRHGVERALARTAW